MTSEWGVVGTVAAGGIALIIALGRGLLFTPGQVEQWRYHLHAWESRWQDMRDDRDYWRAKAHDLQDKIDNATTSRSEGLEDDHD